MGLKREFAVCGGGFAIALGARHLVVRGPVVTAVDGVERGVKLGAVFFKQGMVHGIFLKKIMGVRVQLIWRCSAWITGDGLRNGAKNRGAKAVGHIDLHAVAKLHVAGLR